MKSGRPGTSSRLAHQAAKWAAEQGKDDEFRHKVFAAHWQEDRDISQMSTLREIVAELQLDPDAMEATVTSGEFLQRVLSEEGEAMEYGIGGVPAFIFADKYLVSGAQPPDVLVRIADKVMEELQK
jgi:predicted DsbA family dithiol-disulfide isomerase